MRRPHGTQLRSFTVLSRLFIQELRVQQLAVDEPPHVFLPTVISRGTPIDDGVPLPLIPRHSTARSLARCSPTVLSSLLGSSQITADTNQDPTMHGCRA